MHRPTLRKLVALGLCAFCAGVDARATPQSAGAPPPIDTGSDGSDGAFFFVPDAPNSAVMTVDLALAASGLTSGGQPITWATPSPVAGRGVYDPFAWAVVFKYSQVLIPSDKTVQFKNHPSRAPVVWLVQGDVTLDSQSSLSLDAKLWYEGPVPVGDKAPHWLEPGPGGFRGSAWRSWIDSGWPRGAGLGLGGGFLPLADPNGIAFEHGNYATPDADDRGVPYGGPALFPLVGGSGSGGGGIYYSSTQQVGGAPGGGAILIATQGVMTLRYGSKITAHGSVAQAFFNGSSGSGGAIRLVASTFRRELRSHVVAAARGGNSNQVSSELPGGRVRLEAYVFAGSFASMPPPSIGTPSPLLPDASTPAVRIASVQVGARQHPVATDPRSDTESSSTDVLLSDPGAAIFHIEARNVAPGHTVQVRVTNLHGNAAVVTSTPLVGTQALSTATVSTSLTGFLYAVQARIVL